MKWNRFAIINNIVKRGFLLILLTPTLIISFIFDMIGRGLISISRDLDKGTAKSIQKIANAIGYYDVK